MKILALIFTGLLAVQVGLADTTLVAQATANKPAAKGTTTKKAEPAKPEEPKIPGTSVMRGDGTYLGLEVVGGQFKLSFYDKKKKIMAPTVTRASARWPNPRAPGDNRTILNPSGNALIGSKPVLPPFTFNVYLTLLEGEGDQSKAVETLVIPFRG